MATKSVNEIVAATPGPWRVNTGNFNTDRLKREGVVASVESEEWFVADVWGDFEAEEGESDAPPRGTGLANAQLMAAAPALLAAAKKLRQVVDALGLDPVDGDYRSVLEQADIAIAHAEGREAVIR